MTARNRFSARERAARSRLAQVLYDHEVIVGSVVRMARRCGKAGCRCTQGAKHTSLYLSVNVEAKRRLIYIPGDLEDSVRQQVAAYREVEQLTQEVSAACVERVLTQKRQGKGGGESG